jgi:hypothetical protein
MQLCLRVVACTLVELAVAKDELLFGSKEGRSTLLADYVPPMRHAAKTNEHEVLVRASEVWLRDGPLNWGHYYGQYPNFHFWNNISDLTATYPHGYDKDLKEFDKLDKPVPFERGQKLWPWVTKHTKHVTGRAPIIWLRGPDICALMRLGHYDRPYILISDLGDNWGLLSHEIKDRTTNWGNLEKKLKACQHTLQDVVKWLDDPKLLKVVVNQHVHPLLSGHKKIMQVPIGIPGDFQIQTLKPFFGKLFKGNLLKNVHRTRLLNRKSSDSGLKHRAVMNALLEKEFPITEAPSATDGTTDKKVTTRCCGLASEICNGVPWGCEKYVPYLDDMMQSKFVLTLSGLGYDTWRHTEALYAGAIPVFEHGDGVLNGTYHDLPVLMIDNYATLTPAFLEAEYLKIMANLDSYNWARLSSKWYVDQITAIAIAAAPDVR